MIKQKSLEFIIIQMVKFTKEILKKINGNGIYYYECGDKYKRICIMVMVMFIMENGKIVKKMGKELLIIKVEIKYDGYWEEGKKSGKGIYYFKNGDFFKGEWKNRKKMGKEFFIIKIKIWKKKDLGKMIF